MNIVILAGSNRNNATSTRLGEYAVEIIRGQGHQVSLFDLYKSPLPFYAPDEKQADHEHLADLNTRMLAADAIILSTPEYHGSISGVLKNALDHLSQAHFSGKPVLSISSSGGAVGVSSLLQLQAIVRNLHGINAQEWISIGGAQRRRFEATFDGYEEYEGSQDIEDRVQRVIGSFLNLAQTLTNALEFIHELRTNEDEKEKEKRSSIMITGIFETHLNVTDLERSHHFYEKVLGLPHAYGQKERGNSFYWIGGKGNAMLGLWQKEPSEVKRQHFAFHVSLEDMKHAVAHLENKGIQTHNFLNDDIGELYVFSWMPAVSVYFTDPDGHSLEFIAMLPDEAKPELGMVPWSQWEEMQGRSV